MKVAVIGGGVAGLSAALGLLEAGAEPTVFEAEPRAGGKVGSLREHGFLTENGPNALAASAASAFGLAQQLGLGGEIREAKSPAARWVFRAGRLRKAPGPGLLSPAGFARALCEPLVPGRRLEADLPLRDYLVGRLGPQAGALAAELMAGGVYAGDPARLSARDAFPSLGKLAKSHRSLVLGALSARRSRPAQNAADSRPRSLWSFAEGLGALTSALAARLGGRLRTGAAVTALAPEGGGFRVACAGGEAPFDAAVLALPAFAAAELVRGFAPSLAEALGAVPYAPIAVVHLGVAEAALAPPASGFGLLDGDRSLSLLGALFPAWLFPGRAPPGHALLTSLVGGARRPELVARPEGELVDLVREDLRRALGLSAPPAYARVVRHARAIPQVEVGHAERLRAIDAALGPWPGLALCGAAYRGVSVDACAADGLRAASELAAR
ncbi:MAG: protoporphyrinogen oxidase [Myxococcales bacterium]